MKALLFFAVLASAAEVRFGTPASEGEAKAITVLAFSPDGLAVAAGATDGSVGLYSAASGRELWRLAAHKHEVWAAAFSPDGRLLASGGADTRLLLHDARTGALVRTIRPGRRPITQLAFLPDGRLVCDGERETLEVWDVATGANVRSLAQHPKDITEMSVSPDGRTIATASEGGSLSLWDVSTGRRLSADRAGEPPCVFNPGFSADGGTLFAQDRTGRRLCRFGVPGGKPVAAIGIGDPVGTFLPLPGSRLIGLAYEAARGGGGSLDLLDPSDGTRVTVFRGDADAGARLAFSADGKYAASAGGGGAGVIWPTSARAAPVEDAATGVSTAVLRAALEAWSDQARAEADFDSRRRLYSESKDYDPYGESVREPMNALREAVEDEQYKAALALANELLAAHPVLTEVHGYAATACSQLGDEERGRYHQRYARGLVDSVRRSGDGKTTGTAFKLVHMAEQDAVASTLAGSILARSTLESGGRRFDAWQLGKETVYFDITAIWDWSMRRFGGGE